MYLFHVFYSFLPLRNPIGFGAADFVLFLVAALLVFCTLLWPFLKPYMLKIAASMSCSIVLLAALPVVLRLALLPRYPTPQPAHVILLPAALFSASCYWMLRGWTKPGWALLGGLLCVLELGPLSPWMNSDPGGAMAAAVGCLVLGALPRLFTIRTPGIKMLSRFQFALPIIVSLCAARFLFWYGLHLCAPEAVVAAMARYETWRPESPQP